MLFDPKWQEVQKPKVYDEASQTLLKAADYIEEHGWCRFRFKYSSGEVCIRGAVHMVTGTTFTSAYMYPNSMRFPLYKVCRQLGWEPNDENVAHLGVWNDTAETTKDEVVALLRAAAEL